MKYFTMAVFFGVCLLNAQTPALNMTTWICQAGQCRMVTLDPSVFTMSAPLFGPSVPRIGVKFPPSTVLDESAIRSVLLKYRPIEHEVQTEVTASAMTQFTINKGVMIPGSLTIVWNGLTLTEGLEYTVDVATSVVTFKHPIPADSYTDATGTVRTSNRVTFRWRTQP